MKILEVKYTKGLGEGFQKLKPGAQTRMVAGEAERMKLRWNRAQLLGNGSLRGIHSEAQGADTDVGPPRTRRWLRRKVDRRAETQSRPSNTGADGPAFWRQKHTLG